LGATADDVGARGPSPPRPSVVFGAARVDSAGSQAFTYARFRPCWTGTFEDLTVSAASGKFPSHSATPLAFLPPFLRSISSLLSVLPSAPKGGWPQAPRYLSSGFPKIAPPSVLPARVNSPPCGVRSGLVPRALAPALSRVPLLFRPRRLIAASPVCSSCRLPGCCTWRRSWGSARFCSPPALTVGALPALSLLPFEALLPGAGCAPHSRVDRGGTSPLHRCRCRVHRSPCLLVLGRNRNLEAFLPHQSRTPVRRCQRR